MKWNIVADSACDLYSTEALAGRAGFTILPFSIRTEGMEYVDDESLIVDALLNRMEGGGSDMRTTWPPPCQWADAFRRAERTVAITVSGRQSRSYSSAKIAREFALKERPGRQILLLDSRSTGPAMALCVHRLAEWIDAGHSIRTIEALATHQLENTHTVFALSAFDNLVASGRISSVMSYHAKAPGLWGVGIGDPRGESVTMGRARGRRKALAMILEDMNRRGYAGGDAAIHHCFNAASAARLKELIQSRWQSARVTIRPTRGLNSFYAERGGLIVAYCV